MMAPLIRAPARPMAIAPKPIAAPVRMPEIKPAKPIEAPKVLPPPPKPPQLVSGFGKITSFIDDKTVSTIECAGPDKKVKIVKAGAIIETDISLNNGEIQEILKKFSSQAGIPLKPVFSASIKNLTINATVSEVVGSRFVIKKS